MRLDKYLKVSRIFKRRTVAKDVSEAQRVLVNGRVAKPSTDVKEGDTIAISYGQKRLTVKVLQVAETVRKADAEGMYEVLAEEKIASAAEGALR